MDGNERTAAVLCETFILLNDADLRVDDVELCPIYLALAADSLIEQEFADWLRARLVLAGDPQINDSPARYARR